MLKHFLSYFRAAAALISGQAASRHVVIFTAVFQTFTALLCHNLTIGVEKWFKIFEICSNIYICIYILYYLWVLTDRQSDREINWEIMSLSLREVALESNLRRNRNITWGHQRLQSPKRSIRFAVKLAQIFHQTAVCFSQCGPHLIR